MYIAIAGNIGAGKTTLVGRLSEHLGFAPVYEGADLNPYLQDFYQDMARWSFPLQVCFLSHRFRQGLDISHSDKSVILDRTIYEDAEVFAENLYRSGALQGRDYQTYRFLYETMQQQISPPDLLIYLKANTEVLAQRIRQRNLEKKAKRKGEELIPIDYLNNLNVRYHQWITSFSLCPVITWEIDKRDLNEPAHFKTLIEQIHVLIK